jgi:hypothetical protein
MMQKNRILEDGLGMRQERNGKRSAPSRKGIWFCGTDLVKRDFGSI